MNFILSLLYLETKKNELCSSNTIDAIHTNDILTYLFTYLFYRNSNVLVHFTTTMGTSVVSIASI